MATLNNPNAYQFCNNVVSNTIIKILAEYNIKAKMSTSPRKNSSFTTVEVSIPKIGKVACLAGNIKNNIIALSMHHMMNCANIGFIFNNKLYIVSQLSLQSNWNNLIKKSVYTYTDGTGTRTTMTPADIDILCSIAENVYDISETIYTEYINKRIKYFGS